MVILGVKSALVGVNSALVGVKSAFVGVKSAFVGCLSIIQKDMAQRAGAGAEASRTLQSSLHYVSDDSSIFTLRKLDWDKSTKTTRGPRTRAIQRVVSGNGMVVIATTAGTILRWKMVDALYREPEEIDLGVKNDDNIDNIVLDPSGHHIIISMKNGDNYHLHSRSNKPKKLSKLSGTIESAAFDVIHSSELNTKSFLVGTSTGAIYELALDNTGKEKVCQLVYQLDQSIPITSIYFEQISGAMDGSAANNFASSSGTSDTKYLVLCATTTPTRLYHFVGGPSFQHVFAEYTAHSASPFTELPGELKRAELHCYSKMLNGRAQSFAMMTGAGIYNGSLLGMSNG
jgi:vacuolar protein sorting-associated protein 18